MATLCKVLMCSRQWAAHGLVSKQLCFGNYRQFVSQPYTHISRLLRNHASKKDFNSLFTTPAQNTLFPGRKNTHILLRMFTSSCIRRSKNVTNTAKNVTNTAKNGAKQVTKKSPPIKLKSGEAKRLIALMTPERWRLFGALLCLLLSSGVSMSVPYFIGRIIDIIYSEHAEGEEMLIHLKTFCLTLGLVFILGGLANFGRVYILQTSSQRIVKRLREMLFGRIMKQEVGFFDKTKTGELINRLSTDTSLVAQSLSQNVSDGLRAMFQVTAGVGMMTYVSSKLTLIAMGIVPPVAIASIVYGRYLRNITRNVQDSLADATHVAEEKISNIRTVKAFAHESLESQNYNHGIQKVLDLSYQEALARAVFWGFTGFSGNVIIITVLYFGGFMMLESSISVGDLSSFLLYAAYVGASLGGLTTFYTELNRGIAASYRIWELIDRQPSLVEQCSTALSKVEGNFVFENVFFSYPSRSDVNIFSNLSMEIPARKVTAVVGPSGSGKSTVGHLLLRFYDPTSGTISLDGHNIQDLDSSFLRSLIGVVSQEPVLFSSSVYDNIAYGAPSPSLVSEAEVLSAAIKANANQFIESFPQGMNTLVGQKGQMLSGGQRQRIAIARAIVKNPKILILDEATSALDAESEFYVQDALEQLMVGRTVLIIAHRLSTIMTADNILVIDRGQLVEHGTYEELMMMSGLFRRLVDRQTLAR